MFFLSFFLSYPAIDLDWEPDQFGGFDKDQD